MKYGVAKYLDARGDENQVFNFIQPNLCILF